MNFQRQEMETLVADLDLAIDETAHIHHCKEGQGNDRMYITNKEDCYLFYCHHCGSKGKLNKKFKYYNRHVSPERRAVKHISTEPPQDALYKAIEFPVKAISWLAKSKLTLQQVEQQGIWWSERLQRVGIPVVADGYQGFIARNIDTDGAKYLVRRKDAEKFIFRRKPNKDSKTVVIVEDAMSCIRLSYAGYNSVALQGTALTDTMLAYLIDNYTRFVLWLDDDKPEVKIKQVKIKQELELFGNVSMRKTPNDPKEYTRDELRLIVGDV
jgi:DNA primase